MLKSNRVNLGISMLDISQNFKQSVFIFFVQMSLVFLIGKEIFSESKFQLTSYEMLVIRFICALLLHIQLEKEIRVALGMIKYFATHRSLFDASVQPFLIAMMKLLGAWMTEGVNILLICK